MTNYTGNLEFPGIPLKLIFSKSQSGLRMLNNRSLPYADQTDDDPPHSYAQTFVLKCSTGKCSSVDYHESLKDLSLPAIPPQYQCC